MKPPQMAAIAGQLDPAAAGSLALNGLPADDKATTYRVVENGMCNSSVFCG
jgi:hypothetical protein